MTGFHSPLPRPTPTHAKLADRVRELRSALLQVPATFALIWRADHGGAIALAVLTALAAVLPAGIAWTGKLIVDAVVAAGKGQGAPGHVTELVLLELGLMAASMTAARLLGLQRELLRARLGNVVNERILEKALELELRHFEDADVYDKMQNARREASARPLSLVVQAFSIAQNAITLGALSALLVRLSPWSVLVVVASSVPAFLAEARLAAASFRLNSWRAPEGRRLNYLEWILTRDSHVKEVKLFGLGPLVLGRYRTLFTKFYDEDRRLAVRRMANGVLFGLVSLAAFYAMYAVVASRAARTEISLGDLTLYLAVFRQGQAAVQAILTAMGGMYEDALYMTNLFAYLAIPTGGERARQPPPSIVPPSVPPSVPPRGRPSRIELRNVSFRYPSREGWALREVSLVLEPGEKLGLVGENGAGKSTLVKLLLRLYDPTEGAILYGGVDLRDMDVADMRTRIGAVFQDFVRYQFTAAENIGLGSPDHVDDRPRIEEAARRGGAAAVVETLPQRYDTVLGGWFEAGQELSAGQWQKLAVARAFMREGAEVLVLDEPTAAIDAEGEHELFERFRALAADRTAIVISHRFSTIRTMADRIVVLKGGRVEELGSHRALLEKNGRYAHLFRMQAQGYLD
ncbi:MAG: ABC transporter permease [Anaeromyxobacter sp. RBG_16_69_14]|nr:MAG: ABC transporter permease [Anaeromyxobacter sp. RBG_16_69_14]